MIKGGGRLKDADLSFGRKHPTLIPDTELGDALIGYIHHNSGHQGRKVNAGIIREQGYSVVGGRKRIQRIIGSCIICKTLRGSPMSQKMADLPEQRLWRTPPFLHCGIDVFGHFRVTDKRTTRRRPETKKGLGSLVHLPLFPSGPLRTIRIHGLRIIPDGSDSFRIGKRRMQPP